MYRKRNQKERFLKRIDDPKKIGIFSAADIEERKHWNDYMDAYEHAIKKHQPKISLVYYSS